MLTERKTSLETTIGTLQRERDILAEQIQARMLTQAQIKSMQQFAARVAEGLTAAEESFEGRRSIIEILNVQATLVIENGQKVVYAQCILGDDKLPIVQQHQ